jgi:succinoglycan biosynthesis protein ExoO
MNSNSCAERSAPVISVIMPVYNAGDTLRRSVESIRQQVGPQHELICVDDASTDDSASKLDTWYAHEPRVRLIRMERNLGPGAARNKGLESARGDYVMFADADDRVMRGVLARLYSLAVQNDSDIVKGTFENVYNDGSRVLASSATIPGPDIETTCLRESALLQSIPVSHCTYFYRRRLLLDHDIRYPSDLEIGEDLVFIARALVAAERVTLTPQVLFHYYQTPASLTRRERPEPGPLLSAIEQKRRVARLLRDRGLDEASDRYLKRWDYQARSYWIPMAHHWTPEACTRVFDAFRTALPEDGCPWLEHSPLPFRYLYALLCSREDEQAVSFLRSGEILGHFESAERERAAKALIEKTGTGNVRVSR